MDSIAIGNLAESSAWVSVGSSAAPELARLTGERLAQRISQGQFKSEDVENIAKRRLTLVHGDLLTNSSRLEKLRLLCQLFDVDLKLGRVTSHRPLIGPVIVLAKRMLFPLAKVMFKESFKQQRDFNAAVIALLADLANEEGRSQ